jgi:hypothetical protein
MLSVFMTRQAALMAKWQLVGFIHGADLVEHGEQPVEANG